MLLTVATVARFQIDRIIFISDDHLFILISAAFKFCMYWLSGDEAKCTRNAQSLSHAHARRISHAWLESAITSRARDVYDCMVMCWLSCIRGIRRGSVIIIISNNIINFASLVTWSISERSSLASYTAGVSLFDGMERWNGMEWNDHAHRTRYDDLYPLFFATFSKLLRLVVSEVLKKMGSIWSNRETREVLLEINPKVGAPGFQVQWWIMHLSMYCPGTTPPAKGGDLTCMKSILSPPWATARIKCPLRTVRFCPIICKYWSNPPDPGHI